MATVSRENIGPLNDKLSITVAKEDYLPEFEKKIKDYGKKANIPGFRKGMVPASVIKKMYGASIYQDEVLRSVEKELGQYLDKEKPEIFAQPLPYKNDLSGLNMNEPGNVNFDFEIGIKPQFEIPALADKEVTKYTVPVSDEMVNDEINRLQIKGGKMMEREVVDNDEDVIYASFAEVDETGGYLENGIKKDNSVLFKYFSPALQEQLRGKKKGDTVVFRLNEAFEGEKLDAMLRDLGLEKDDAESGNKKFKLEINKIELVEKRALDEVFYKEIYPGKEIKTEEEFRKQVKEDIEKGWDAEATNQVHDQIYHFLIDSTKIDLPSDFLKRWLQHGGEKLKSPEQAENEYPSFANQLKWTLITDRLIKENNLDVEPDEIKQKMRDDVSRYFGQMNLGEDAEWLNSYIDRMMKDQKQVESTYHRLVAEKLFNWASTQVKTKNETISAEEFAKLAHHHHH